MVDTVLFMIGLGIVFGIAILFSYISKTNLIKGVIAYGMIIAPFVYKAGLLEFWVLIALMFLTLALLFSEIKNRRN